MNYSKIAGIAGWIGGLAVLSLLGGCRHRPAPQGQSPWLAMKQAPPEEGALGILAGPGGLEELPLTSVGAGRAERVPAGACVSLSAPLLPGEPSGYPAVYAQERGRALLWGPSGWGWVDLAATGTQVRPLAAHLEEVLASTRDAVAERTSAEGWTLHSGWLLTLAVQPVRTEPREDAPPAATGFPGNPMEGDGVWRGARAGAFAPGSRAKPLAFLKLDIMLAPRPVAEVVARPFERRGDWLQVGFPRAGSATFLADAHGIGADADQPALLVQWATEPAGWVRLAKPGPRPGTQVRLWSWRYLGRRD